MFLALGKEILVILDQKQKVQEPPIARLSDFLRRC